MRELPLVDVPVACSLTADELRDRAEEWRAVLASAHDVQRAGSTLRLQLDAVDVAKLAALCRDEVECCPFFAFEVAVAAAGTTLTVRVPPDAAPVLDGLVGLLP